MSSNMDMMKELLDELTQTSEKTGVSVKDLVNAGISATVKGDPILETMQNLSMGFDSLTELNEENPEVVNGLLGYICHRYPNLTERIGQIRENV